MSLSEDPLRGSFGLRLMQLARHWRMAVDARLRRDAFPDAGWRPLFYLHRAAQPLRQKDLAALIGIEEPSLVRLLDGLATAGLLMREADPEDRRARRVRLTPAGTAAAGRIEARLLEVEQDLLRQVDGETLAAAQEALARIEEALKTRRDEP